MIRNDEKYKDVKRFGRITVHDNCFIGWGSIILPGVTIGPNSVVGAGSLVTKDVPAGEIHGGNPAKRISTVADFAEKMLGNSTVVNEEAYALNREKELLRVLPRPW